MKFERYFANLQLELEVLEQQALKTVWQGDRHAAQTNANEAEELEGERTSTAAQLTRATTRQDNMMHYKNGNSTDSRLSQSEQQ